VYYVVCCKIHQHSTLYLGNPIAACFPFELLEKCVTFKDICHHDFPVMEFSRKIQDFPGGVGTPIKLICRYQFSTKTVQQWKTTLSMRAIVRAQKLICRTSYVNSRGVSWLVSLVCATATHRVVTAFVIACNLNGQKLNSWHCSKHRTKIHEKKRDQSNVNK